MGLGFQIDRKHSYLDLNVYRFDSFDIQDHELFYNIRTLLKLPGRSEVEVSTVEYVFIMPLIHGR
jgi:hypothetical protein